MPKRSSPTGLLRCLRAEDNTEWNLAWALHAGVSYEISSDVTLDLGYRFTYLGDGETGRYSTFGTTTTQGPTTLKDIVSHDVMVGPWI